MVWRLHAAQSPFARLRSGIGVEEILHTPHVGLDETPCFRRARGLLVEGSRTDCEEETPSAASGVGTRVRTFVFTIRQEASF